MTAGEQPMSDLRGRIAAVADHHAAMGFDADYGPNDDWVCHCGVTWTAGGTHGEHVADAVIAELGLRQEWRATGNSCAGPQESREEALLYGDTTERRFVTDWEADDE